MRRNTLIAIFLTLTVAAVAVGVTAIAALFFLEDHPAVANASPAPTAIPRQTSPTQTTEPEDTPINPADVLSIALNTNYKGYFANGVGCNDPAVSSPGEKCELDLSISADGSASKSIQISRYDTAGWHIERRNEWKATVSRPQFDDLARLIVTNKAFLNWNDRVSITVRNAKITVTHKKGVKSPMSNVDEKTTEYLQMIDALKALDKNMNWVKN